MIVTRELLAPYRNANGNVRISWNTFIRYGHQALPDDLFTSTLDAFPSICHADGVDDRELMFEISVVLAFTSWAPPLGEHRIWYALVHQAGGYLCEQHRMVATMLKPRPEVLTALKEIVRHGFFADEGRFSRSDLRASRLAWYLRGLSDIGLDCECTWRSLSESLYPVDATQANLNRIAADAPYLADLCDWTGSPWYGNPPIRYCSDPVIFFMTENSD